MSLLDMYYPNEILNERRKIYNEISKNPNNFCFVTKRKCTIDGIVLNKNEKFKIESLDSTYCPLEARIDVDGLDVTIDFSLNDYLVKKSFVNKNFKIEKFN